MCLYENINVSCDCICLLFNCMICFNIELRVEICGNYKKEKEEECDFGGIGV